MGPKGYSWGSTSQWSNLPTVPADQKNNQAAQNTTDSQNAPTNNNSYSNNAPQPQMNSNQTPPETRRDMIVRLYKSILGREADNAGLNYYLSNYQISESEIAKEMLESTEHLDIVTKARDIREMLTKMEENDHKMKEMELKLKNAETLAENYKALSEQKAQVINELMSQGAVPSNPMNPTVKKEDDYAYKSHDSDFIHTDANSYSNSSNDDDGVLLQDPFAEDFSKSGKKGCFSMIKGLFKFN